MDYKNIIIITLLLLYLRLYYIVPNNNSPNYTFDKCVDKNNTGIVILLNTRNSPGCYIRCSMLSQYDTRVINNVWDSNSKDIENIQIEILEYLRNKFYGKLVFYEIHNDYPTFSEILPILLDLKGDVEKLDYSFDIILTLDNVVNWVISDFNSKYQYKNINNSLEHFKEHIKIQPNAQIRYFYNHFGNFHPWIIENVQYNHFQPYKFLNETYNSLNKIDFIFHADNLKEVEIYFKLKFNINWKSALGTNVEELITKDMLTIEILNEILSLNSIEQAYITKARELGIEKFDNFLSKYVPLTLFQRY